MKALKKAVPLSAIKTEKDLKNMVLLKISRLSVQPVTEAEYDKVVELGNR